jgi:hypothetical protein
MSRVWQLPTDRWRVVVHAWFQCSKLCGAKADSGIVFHPQPCDLKVFQRELARCLPYRDAFPKREFCARGVPA